MLTNLQNAQTNVRYFRKIDYLKKELQIDSEIFIISLSINTMVRFYFENLKIYITFKNLLKNGCQFVST